MFTILTCYSLSSSVCRVVGPRANTFSSLHGATVFPGEEAETTGKRGICTANGSNPYHHHQRASEKRKKSVPNVTAETKTEPERAKQKQIQRMKDVIKDEKRKRRQQKQQKGQQKQQEKEDKPKATEQQEQQEQQEKLNKVNVLTRKLRRIKRKLFLGSIPPQQLASFQSSPPSSRLVPTSPPPPQQKQSLLSELQQQEQKDLTRKLLRIKRKLLLHSIPPQQLAKTFEPTPPSLPQRDHLLVPEQQEQEQKQEQRHEQQKQEEEEQKQKEKHKQQKEQKQEEEEQKQEEEEEQHHHQKQKQQQAAQLPPRPGRTPPPQTPCTSKLSVSFSPIKSWSLSSTTRTSSCNSSWIKQLEEALLLVSATAATPTVTPHANYGRAKTLSTNNLFFFT